VPYERYSSKCQRHGLSVKTRTFRSEVAYLGFCRYLQADVAAVRNLQDVRVFASCAHGRHWVTADQTCRVQSKIRCLTFAGWDLPAVRDGKLLVDISRVDYDPLHPGTALDRQQRRTEVSVGK
jgi:hypothetical protein